MTLAQKNATPIEIPVPRKILTLHESVAFLERTVRGAAPAGYWIPGLLEEARGAENWYVARRHDAPDGTYSLQVFVWPAGSWTKVHDHSAWGALRCAFGSVVEDRYERLDDGSLFEHARLRECWRREWKAMEGVSTVLPYDGGIHRIGNPGAETAISIHLYGPRMGPVDGRDYDPARDYVCDRRDD